MELFENLLLALLPAALCFWAYRQGLRDGMGKAGGKPPATIVRPRGKRPAETPEERRLRQLMANVEAYDGTANGQKEVV